MYYIGENTIDLIIKLIDEIETKKKIINADYKKLEQYSKIKNMLDSTSKEYYKERNDVLEYLKDYKNIYKDEYDKVLLNIRSLNSHKFYGRINDNDISTFYCDYIDLNGNDNSITNVYTYKQKVTDISLFTIPIVCETKSIIDDNNFINKYSNAYSKYKSLKDLNCVLDRYVEVKKIISNRKTDPRDLEKYKIMFKEYGKEIKSLRNSISEFYKENPDIEKFIYSNIKAKGKITWIEMTKYSIAYFENIYMPKILKQLYEELKTKNEKAINYGNTINNCLLVKIEAVGNNILDTATCFEQSYILKYIDSIYPGFREELISSLKTNNIERINYLESLIIDTLYLEDKDYNDEILSKKKCL